MRSWFVKQWGAMFSRDASRAPIDSPSIVDDFDAGQAIPDDLVDAILNEEVEGDESARVFDRLRREPGAMRTLEETEYSIDALKGARPSSPDLSSHILGEVDRRKGLFDRHGLRRVWLWRGLAITGVVLAVAGVFLAERMTPADVNLTGDPAPLSDLLSALPEERTQSTAYAFSDLRQFEDVSQPVLVRAEATTDETGGCPLGGERENRCWCPYQNMLPAGGPTSLTASWVTLVAAESPPVRRCTLERDAAIKAQGAGGFSTVRDLYDPGGSTVIDAVDRDEVGPRR